MSDRPSVKDREQASPQPVRVAGHDVVSAPNRLTAGRRAGRNDRPEPGALFETSAIIGEHNGRQ